MQYVGIVTITVNGNRYNSKPGSSFNPGGYDNEMQEGDQNIGYSQKRVPARVESTFMADSAFDIYQLRDLKDATVQFDTDNGLSFVLRSAWIESVPTMSGAGGDVPVVFVADSSDQIS